MGQIIIQNMNLGIASRPDPANIPEGAVADAYGFDLTKGGSLVTAGGLKSHDYGSIIPSGLISCLREYYIGTTLYTLVTAAGGLYANGTLVSSGFGGKFKGVSFGNQIYLVNGSSAVRFDGTNIYKWGITAPTSVPTIAPGTYLSTQIDTFESLTTWIANDVDCTVSADAVDKKQGSQSMKITTLASKTGYSYVTGTKDLTLFSSGATSSEEDYIAFWFRVDNLINLEYVSLIFDTSDGTFSTDTFSYDIVSPQDNTDVLQSLGVGKTTETVSQDTIYSEDDTNQSIWSSDVDGTYPVIGYQGPRETITVTKNVTKTLIDPILSDQVFSFWRRNDLYNFKNNVWQFIKIPKKLFVALGSPDWSTIVGWKVIVKTTSEGTAVVNLDDLKIIGGSDLTGDYWFTWTFSRNDSNGNIIHESSPARSGSQVIVSGPVKFDRQPVTYSGRALSTDSQVNGGNLYAVGGMLGDFWLIASVANNSSTSGTLSSASQKNALRTLNSVHNFPAPAGTDLIVYKSKIWMVGFNDYPALIRSSDILNDGTLAPEGWPTRNGYLPDGNTGELWDIDLLNGVMNLKGKAGEWLVDTVDPTDFLAVSARRLSNNGMLEKDAIVKLQSSHLYATSQGFVETNGSNVSFIFPELANIIEDGIRGPQCATSGLVSYFSYHSETFGSRTAKVDLYDGKPRFMNMNNILFDYLYYSKHKKKVYGIVDNQLCIVDAGSENELNVPNRLQLYVKSRVYRLNQMVGWNWIAFDHFTNNLWYELRVYINDVLSWVEPFRSTSRTTQYFRFGPVSGYDCRFELSGDYNLPGVIYFPIRISHGGE